MFSFPDINTEAPIKVTPEVTIPSKKEESKEIKDTKDIHSKKDHKSDNIFNELAVEDNLLGENEEKKPEEKKQNKGKKKKSKNKKEWKKIDANIKIATTEVEKEMNMFEKVEEKVISYSEQNEGKKFYESRFPVSKPTDGIFRNFDNKPRVEPITTSKYAPSRSDDNVKFGRPKPEYAFAVKPADSDGKPEGWRNPEIKSTPIVFRKESDSGQEAPSGDGPKRRFFNLGKNSAAQDPLKPKEQETQKPKTDVWGEDVKPTEKANAWRK